MNTIFFGSAQFSISILGALLDLGYQVTVVTEPDKPAGRGRKLTPNPVKKFALGHRLKILEDFHQLSSIVRAPRQARDKLHRELITSPTEQSQWRPSESKNKNIEFGILAAYGKILPPEILDLFPKGILNFHPSLLPKYRGASPIPGAILAGEQETGITIIKLAEHIDAGEIIAQEKIRILPRDTAASLTEKLSRLSIAMLKKHLPKYLKNPKSKIQNPKLASYTKKIQKEDGRINWQEDPKIIDRKIRAYNSWPKAFWETNKTRVIFLESEFELGKLKILKLQVAGKKPISGKEFILGYKKLLTAFPKFVMFK